MSLDISLSDVYWKGDGSRSFYSRNFSPLPFSYDSWIIYEQSMSLLIDSEKFQAIVVG